MPIKFSPCATNPCVATPNRGHVPTKPCTTTNRAARPPESCKKNIRAEPHEPPRRAPVQAVVTNRRAVHPSRASRTAGPCICPSTRQCTRPCIRSTRALGRAHARHAHLAVHTPEHTHNLAQVTLDLLCSTLSYMNNMFCFCLYTSRLSAGLIMWDNSQFLFFLPFLFKLHTYLT